MEESHRVKDIHYVPCLRIALPDTNGIFPDGPCHLLPHAGWNTPVRSDGSSHYIDRYSPDFSFPENIHPTPPVEYPKAPEPLILAYLPQNRHLLEDRVPVLL